MKKANNFQIAYLHPQGIADLLLMFFSNFSLDLLIKVLLTKKGVINDFVASVSWKFDTLFQKSEFLKQL